MKVIVRTKNEDFEIQGIEENTVYVDKGVIFFANKAAVNLEDFLSYMFVDEKEKE